MLSANNDFIQYLEKQEYFDILEKIEEYCREIPKGLINYSRIYISNQSLINNQKTEKIMTTFLIILGVLLVGAVYTIISISKERLMTEMVTTFQMKLKTQKTPKKLLKK